MENKKITGDEPENEGPVELVIMVRKWTSTMKYPCPQCNSKVGMPDYLCTKCNIKLKPKMQM